MSQADCVEAMKSGWSTKTKIALEAKLSIEQVDKALNILERSGLAKKLGRLDWRLTKQGRDAHIEVVSDPEGKRGQMPHTAPMSGSSTERLLQILDTPTHVKVLAKRLGLTRQRVHQIAISLLAQNLIRLADDGGRIRLISRYNDPTVLLSADEERVLSVTPEEYPSSRDKIRVAAKISPERMGRAFRKLLDAQFLIKVASPHVDQAYRLSPTGIQHPQRVIGPTQANRIPLKVNSDRVFTVLSFLKEHGDARIVTIRDALAIPQKTMNALMQYLKRVGLVRKANVVYLSPYTLTEEGVFTQSEMKAMRHR